MAELAPLIAPQGVTVRWSSHKWDAINPESTAHLVDEWFAHSNGATEYVVAVSNFSGALIQAGLFDEFEPCLEQLLARLYNKKYTVLWIEPQTSDARKRLFPKLWDFLKRRLPAFLGGEQGQELMLSAAYELSHPLHDEAIPSALTVQRFVRQ